MILFKRKVTPSVIFWNDANIPAKLFFEILSEGNLSKLGIAKPEELDSVFNTIFDEYVQLDGNSRIMEWYRKKCKVVLINIQLQTISNIIYAIAYIEMTVNERIGLIEKLNNINGVNVRFSLSKPILEEISRVQNVVLGTLKNRLNIEMSTEKKQSESVIFSFEADIVSIENVLGRTIDDSVSLRKYVELKKSAKEKVDIQKANSRKNGR